MFKVNKMQRGDLIKMFMKQSKRFDREDTALILNEFHDFKEYMRKKYAFFNKILKYIKKIKKL